MNITCSPINKPNEIVKRMLYLVPGPLLLAAFFCPVWALAVNDWSFLFLGVLCGAASLYMRELGVRVWEFARLDDEFEKLASYPCGFALRDENNIDEILSQAEEQSNRYFSEEELLADFSILKTSRDQRKRDPWRN
jgi:hypothetical protein